MDRMFLIESIHVVIMLHVAYAERTPKSTIYFTYTTVEQNQEGEGKGKERPGTKPYSSLNNSQPETV